MVHHWCIVTLVPTVSVKPEVSEKRCGAGLYMCQYMLIIPTLTDVLRRIGVSTGLVGAIAGASDFASMFMTPGAPPHAHSSADHEGGNLNTSRRRFVPTGSGSSLCIPGSALWSVQLSALCVSSAVHPWPSAFVEVCKPAAAAGSSSSKQQVAAKPCCGLDRDV